MAEHCRCEICPNDGCSYVECFDSLDWVDMYEICIEVASRVNGKNEMDWDEFLEFYKCVRNSLKMADSCGTSGLTSCPPQEWTV